MEDLRAGRAVSRRYRNRRIGEFLKELDLTEGRSTGIPKILRNMEANGSPVPEFETDEDRTYYLVRLPAHSSAKVATPEAGAHDEAHEPMTNVEERILASCVSEPRSTPELLHALGYKSRTGNFKRALTRLLDAGYLEMTMPDAPRSKKQKYRLTDRGRDALKNMEMEGMW